MPARAPICICRLNFAFSYFFDKRLDVVYVARTACELLALKQNGILWSLLFSCIGGDTLIPYTLIIFEALGRTLVHYFTSYIKGILKTDIMGCPITGILIIGEGEINEMGIRRKNHWLQDLLLSLGSTYELFHLIPRYCRKFRLIWQLRLADKPVKMWT